MDKYIFAQTAESFIDTLEDNSVRLLLTDPPYYKIVGNSWDRLWINENEFVNWLTDILFKFKQKLTSDGSIVFFSCLGKDKSHPIFDIVRKLEEQYCFRNWITWGKRRAYGKSHDYLYCREEIIWFSVSEERTGIVFNIPLLDEKRGYAGFNKKYPAKSEYKRVSNVWTDIPELFRPTRTAEKPPKLLKRLIETHSNPGDLVVDLFCGTGSTGEEALKLKRNFLGCEVIVTDADKANFKCQKVSNVGLNEKKTEQVTT